ncbi:MAG: WhiB family transcriptional regulator [Actinomycetota bacterium]|nr:WhiB family transcriptional regulator [Actinomycetota bacterium]
MVTTTNPDDRWRPYAACANTDPRPFYGSGRPVNFCDRCPVVELCLWAAMANEQLSGYRYGTWGGASAARRARIAASLPPSVDYTACYQAVVDAWPQPALRLETA